MIQSMKNERPVDRMFARMERMGIGVRQLADKLEINETSRISNWRKRDIPVAMLADVAYAIGVNVDWLITGEGDEKHIGAIERDLAFDNTFKDQFKARTDKATLRLMKTGIMPIPIYDIEASGGFGAFISEEKQIAELRMSMGWARNHIGQIEGTLAIIYVSGDSMEPTFSSGDMVVVDRAPISADDIIDGVHVLRIDGRLFIKRLQVLPGNRLSVISDNHEYERFNLAEGDDFSILGRVKWVWRGKRM